MPSPRLDRLTNLPLWMPLPWAVVAGYFVVFLLLDWASFIRPLEGLNITPWNPQPALAVALLLASRRLWWVAMAALMAAEVLVRGVPGDLFVVALAAGALTCTYLAMASALERAMGEGWRFGSGRDVGLFLAIVAGGALLSGVVYVGTYAAGGFPPPGALWAAVARYWVGDAVGLAVTLPTVLALMDAERRQRLLYTLRQREAWLIGGLILALLWVLFGDGGDSFNYSYLLLLPVIWASMRYGATGAVLASLLTQVGLIVAMQAGPHADLFVFELQLLMVAITMTALLLGVVVDERARAEADLRRTLRLATAGQMSAALAHELSQPLNALGLYAQACEILAAPGRTASADDPGRLLDVVRRMAADARRAGEVVQRLRDFFRTGATHLQPVSVLNLVDEAVHAQAARLSGSGAYITKEVREGLPMVWVDAVQMQVVLRNLLTNALDAALDEGARGEPSALLGTTPAAAAGTSSARVPGSQQVARVRVYAFAGDWELTMAVHDNGPGLSPLQAQAIFEPSAAGDSHKVGGMGVGLSICRAIVEAHGGRMWAEPGPGGRLFFTLPLGNPLHDGGSLHEPAP